MTTLSELKKGDEVTVYRGSYIVGVYRIDKITPAGFIKVDDALYNKDGSRRGGGSIWNRESIVPTTQEHKDFVEKKAIANRLDATNFMSLSLDKLRRIVAIIEEKP